jgi:hypothetical protein
MRRFEVGCRTIGPANSFYWDDIPARPAKALARAARVA